MKKIHVALGAHAYDIEIAAGLLPVAAEGAQGCNYKRYKCCTVICSKITG